MGGIHACKVFIVEVLGDIFNYFRGKDRGFYHLSGVGEFNAVRFNINMSR